MDSFAEEEFNESLRYFPPSSDVFYATTNTNTKTTTHNTGITYTNSLQLSSATATVRNFSSNTNHPSTVVLRKILEKLKHFLLKTLHILLHIFLISTIADGFNPEAVLAVNDIKSSQNLSNTSTVSSFTLLAGIASSQLPVQALVFEANAGLEVNNSFETEISSNGSNNSYTSSSFQKLDDSNNGINTKNKMYDTNTAASLPTLGSAIRDTTAFLPSVSLPTTPSFSSASSSSYLFLNDSLSSMAYSSTTLETVLPDSAATTTVVQFSVPPLHTVLVSIILLFVILGTIVGNVLVCIAVCMVRKLRRPCNYLLVSLALSDLCVAVLVMPMALLYEVLEKWNFGIVLCDIWVSFDVLCCTASILNLCAISVDRYLAITKPLEYGVKRTPRRMMMCVALVWLAAACISLPPLLILGNEHVDEHGNPMCSVCQNFAYQIYATLGSFYIPLAVMLFVYYQIFKAARRIVLEEKRAQTHLQHALNGTGSPPGHTDLDGIGQHRQSSYGNTSLNYSNCGVLSTSHTGGDGGGSGSSGLLGSPHQKKLRFQLAKEKKASTTLGIIMSAFTICWLPFFILALIRPFVENETTHVPQSLSSLFLWLGYANSLLNPIIYATLNRDFRKPFQEILYFRCSSLNTMMRENYYQDQYGEPPSQRVMLGDERHGARESFL